jgi:hypothetical protein
LASTTGRDTIVLRPNTNASPDPLLPPAPVRAGLPHWITGALIEETCKTWQPYYSQDLTENDAIEILQTMGRLIDWLEVDNGNE